VRLTFRQSDQEFTVFEEGQPILVLCDVDQVWSETGVIPRHSVRSVVWFIGVILIGVDS
jgi:hypothetical protein